jgi:hypothetical protein
VDRGETYFAQPDDRPHHAALWTLSSFLEPVGFIPSGVDLEGTEFSEKAVVHDSLLPFQAEADVDSRLRFRIEPH